MQCDIFRHWCLELLPYSKTVFVCRANEQTCSLYAQYHWCKHVRLCGCAYLDNIGTSLKKKKTCKTTHDYCICNPRIYNIFLALKKPLNRNKKYQQFNLQKWDWWYTTCFNARNATTCRDSMNSSGWRRATLLKGHIGSAADQWHWHWRPWHWMPWVLPGHISQSLVRIVGIGPVMAGQIIIQQIDIF